jgi:hypothetical protein
VSFFCSQKLKNLQRQRTDNVETSEHVAMQKVLMITINESERWFQHWQGQQNKCVCIEGAIPIPGCPIS